MPAMITPGCEIVLAQEKVSLPDPHDCTDAKDALSLLHAVYDTLITLEDGRVEPGLAQDWSVSHDACDWRFRLREGVRFHDGTECTAAAVAQSLRRMARADKGCTLGASGVWHQYIGDARVECEDDRTLKVSLTAPLADLPDILAQGFIAAPSMIEAMDAGQATLPSGTGHYRIETAGPDRIVAERFSGHFSTNAGPERVEWIGEPDPDVRLAHLRSGEVQVATNLAPISADGAVHSGVTYLEHCNPVAIIYILNAARGPFVDPLVRKAINLAVDRDAMVARVRNGAAVPLYGIMPALSMGSEQTRRVAPDLKTARRLLDDAGHGDGLTLRLDCPTRLPDEAEALTAELGRQLAMIGVSIDVTLHHDREAYAHMVRRKEIGDLCVFDSSPLSTFRVLHEKIDSRVRGAWWQGYENPEVEAALDRACSMTDPVSRAALYGQIIETLQDDPPWLTLYMPRQIVGLAGAHPEFRMPGDGVLDIARVPCR